MSYVNLFCTLTFKCSFVNLPPPDSPVNIILFQFWHWISLLCILNYFLITFTISFLNQEEMSFTLKINHSQLSIAVNYPKVINNNSLDRGQQFIFLQKLTKNISKLYHLLFPPGYILTATYSSSAACPFFLFTDTFDLFQHHKLACWCKMYRDGFIKICFFST